MIGYFESKQIKDFKNSKLYYEFYSASVKIKSCKTEEFMPNTFIYESNEFSDSDEIGNLFNTFFTNISSTSLASDIDSDNFIDKTFSQLKKDKFITLQTENFKFVHTNENIVERLIFNLSPSSGPGLSEIPSKLIKFAANIFAPILTRLFNHCIDIGRFPVEWKSAIVTE
jgi:hypothetical protein